MAFQAAQGYSKELPALDQPRAVLDHGQFMKHLQLALLHIN